MTEKRFIVKAQPPLWTTSDGIEIESARQDLWDSFEDKTICQFEYSTNTEKMIDLMNSLSEENEELKKENQGIQDKVMRLLDYVELKQCVTRTEITKWWTGDVK